MTGTRGRVAWMAIAPVKSMALAFLDEAELGPDGIAGDRAYARRGHAAGILPRSIAQGVVKSTQIG